jgi:hypothetical protein
MGMMTCSCGSVLVSDGQTWKCPQFDNRLVHEKTRGVEFTDKRIGINGKKAERA